MPISSRWITLCVVVPRPVRRPDFRSKGLRMEDDAEAATGNWLTSWLPAWCPTSMARLREAEARILQGLKSPPVCRYVQLPSSHRIWTLSLDRAAGAAGGQTPLVLVHGFGGGLGLWIQNLERLSCQRRLFAFDLLGFGRSSRPGFPAEPEAVEAEFVRSIEEWREQLGLPAMILLGHSLGGYLAANYCIQHPDRVKHLILVDPWGFPERPTDQSEVWKPPVWVKVLAAVLGRFNFLAILRAAGPWGPSLVQRFRPDLKRKYADMFQDDSILEYVYHCNAQTPSGETAFKVLSEAFGWAKRPMIGRIHLIPKDIPITMIYGSKSWIDSSSGEQVKALRPDSYVRTMSIEGASHHVYSDQPQEFNAVVAEICDSVSETPSTSSQASPSPTSSPSPPPSVTVELVTN
ncbi:(Lyso)-N-acylphosphatidylethanolamine lipase-like [Hypanus sabinus]|uniref:(Lyso)-N-acylphosphatidylethanolamine lipase-like n=1 Tax=Hypanus sabinus TaxID=79690 RepID=UPI0028C3A8AA|nr:(Lyso)-N-acylphosphatidylethanolamine lipase-like [Hypanus sabinus]